MITTKLPARLQCIADEMPSCRRLIDVGSDHGFLSSYVLERRISQMVIATDIHRAPAQRTREYLDRKGFAGKSEVYCRDGLSGIVLSGEDVVVIAGLGGLEMVQILTRALAEQGGVFPKGTVFLLQPQRSEEELRAFLSENLFDIESERICFDRGRTYVIIRCRFIGEPRPLSPEQRILGPFIIKDRPEGTVQYLEGKIRSLEKQRLGRPELLTVIRFANDLLSEERRTDQ